MKIIIRRDMMDSARPHALSVFAVASSTFSSAWVHAWNYGCDRVRIESGL